MMHDLRSAQCLETPTSRGLFSKTHTRSKTNPPIFMQSLHLSRALRQRFLKMPGTCPDRSKNQSLEKEWRNHLQNTRTITGYFRLDSINSSGGGATLTPRPQSDVSCACAAASRCRSVQRSPAGHRHHGDGRDLTNEERHARRDVEGGPKKGDHGAVHIRRVIHPAVVEVAFSQIGAQASEVAQNSLKRQH